MKATRPTDLRALLGQVQARPSKRLGQNFLIDENIARMSLDAAGIQTGDQVLEIGPGAGALTEGLLERGARVLAVEKDERLVELLRTRWAGREDVELRSADALDLPVAELLRGGAIRLVVSNLPYSAGTRILVNLVTAEKPPERMVVMLQTEVAQRLMAKAGTPEYGLLAVWTQRLYLVERLRAVKASCFYPKPDVESTLLRLQLRSQPLAPLTDPAFHRNLTRWVFQHRRKQLARIFSSPPADWKPLGKEPADWLAGLGIP
ncbi:MAG: 16S rRNA (adenine(1518)-N(6)/adenine(1519)-N(6))-dimethyltransferase RsmA, partial [Kiritimatiellia bacterium]|nr:16S rRNA (adenine(1518)-N(6)/adenine(1519)-N(6))-dimethyltransferase RsmA [Kiritimatiellia bacterium]